LFQALAHQFHHFVPCQGKHSEFPQAGIEAFLTQLVERTVDAVMPCARRVWFEAAYLMQVLGGARVIYHWAVRKDLILLLYAYPKNVSADLTPRQVAELAKGSQGGVSR
jgi:hypothetical protein